MSESVNALSAQSDVVWDEGRCDHGSLLGGRTCWACDQDEYEAERVALERRRAAAKTERGETP